MFIILRWICEISSWIAVEIRFLWDSKHGIYGAASFIAIVTSWYLRIDMGNLLQLFWIWTSYVSLSDYLKLTLKFYTVPGRLHDVINIVFMQTRVDFYSENVTSFLNYVTVVERFIPHSILSPSKTTI